MNLLIPYVYLYNHPDPLFDEFTYGESTPSRVVKLKETKKGDYVFFHTSIRGQKYVTAYYVVDRVKDTVVAIKNQNIRSKYNNPHMSEMMGGKRPKESDDVILFGDPILSRKLKVPLLFNKELAKKLSLNIQFPIKRTETQAIGSATRAWRELSAKDVGILFDEIEKCDESAGHEKKLLTSEEVADLVEKHLEDIVASDPQLIGKSLKLEKRQLVADDGRIDLLFEDQEGNKIVVEMKLHKIGRTAINQIKRYMKWVKENTKKKVTGIIVCEGVMPAFEDEVKKHKDIKILCHGWRLHILPWDETI